MKSRPLFIVESASLFVAFLLLVVILPCLQSIGLLSAFALNVWGKYLCYALLAISVDLLWGYTGLLSLGQALFFSLGGYMLGMHLMLMIGKLGQYKSDLPDFMVFQGHTFLPSYWRPFYYSGFAMLMVLMVPVVLSTAFGFLAFRSRIKGVYFSILTQAVTYCAALMFFRNDMSFGGQWLNGLPDIVRKFLHNFFLFNDMPMGGNNGFTDFKFLMGCDLHSDATQRGLFIATSLVLIGVYILCRWLTKTKFGLIQRAVRDSETRVLFSGYAAANFKLFVYVLSAVIASVGGALYVPQVGIINPSEMQPDKSLEAVVWVAVGGRGTLVGPIVGAVVVNALKSWATKEYPDLWLIMLGAAFMLIVLFMPRGIVGLPKQLYELWKRWNPGRDVEDGASSNGNVLHSEEPPPSPVTKP